MYFLSINKIKPEKQADVGSVIKEHIEWSENEIANRNIMQCGKWGEAGGMSIIKADNIEKAKKIIQQDPLVKSDIVNYEIERFYPHNKIG